ncbi:hypothetical protein TWF696_002880 [Orbilia brochopaga]|uniref:Transmembrane protein n=1 Tax=Orbilia brochopaga TaxID=3140254 RepID=A0AAV9U1B3_9PEZI
MFPWHNSLTAWAERIDIRIDALGLVTMLGTKEVDLATGRLVVSNYFGLLPLLGAFVHADNSFTERLPGFTLYNISAGVVTTEVCGWLSRWIKSHEFETAKTEIEWEQRDRPARWTAICIGFFLVSLPVNGMLIALTVLSQDWWGLANALSMITSVIVRTTLIHLNHRGIDANIEAANADRKSKCNKPNANELRNQEAARAEEEHARESDAINIAPPAVLPASTSPSQVAKIAVITDDSRIVSMKVDGSLVKYLFATNPKIERPFLYKATRWVGWAAFAVHVISLGMAGLHTQIYTVVLLISSTVLAVSHFGCDDFRIGLGDRHPCWITSKLCVRVGKHGLDNYESREERGGSNSSVSSTAAVHENKTPAQGGRRKLKLAGNDEEAGHGQQPKGFGEKQKKPPTRQDFYVWLELNDEEDEKMIAWGLIPRNRQWQEVYRNKKEEHARRIARRM